MYRIKTKGNPALQSDGFYTGMNIELHQVDQEIVIFTYIEFYRFSNDPWTRFDYYTIITGLPDGYSSNTRYTMNTL